MNENEILEEMANSLERVNLTVNFMLEPPMFYPYINSEKSDIKKAQEIVEDFGYKLKFYLPSDKSIDMDAEYEIIKKEV